LNTSFELSDFEKPDSRQIQMSDTSQLLQSFAFVEQDPSILSLCILDNALLSAQESPEICAFVVSKILPKIIQLADQCILIF
jgi:hypothetical protein